MKKIGLSVVVICFFLAGSRAGALFSKSATDKVLMRLKNLDSGATSSCLIQNDLVEAYREYKSWPEVGLAKLTQRDPLVRFLVHFLYIPMDTNSLMPDNSKDNIDWKPIIERLDRSYKRFKPGYLGQTTISKRFTKDPYTFALEKALFKLKDSQPLSKEMFQQAMQEYNSIAARTEEIAGSNVYANIDEYENNLNYLNRLSVQVLEKSVFPDFDTSLEMDVFDPEYLTNLFKQEMFEKGIAASDGIWYVKPGRSV